MRLSGYDLETTKIDIGTPELLYLTVFGDEVKVSARLDKASNRLEYFGRLLETHCLIPELNRMVYVAWNGNKFDCYFIIRALLETKRWVMKPYMTASKSLRGLLVKSKDKVKVDGKLIHTSFQFLDGIAMTGLVGKTLKSFLSTFAPDLPKLELDLDAVAFDPDNAEHVKYAERDSEGLFVGMKRVSEILHDLTGLDLKPTLGNIAIRYFMANAPGHKRLIPPNGKLLELLHGPVKRGGYCWCARQYHGPVWKYDINQAYASAMRDAMLPCGESASVADYSTAAPGIYLVTFSRKIPSPIPFYYKDAESKIGLFTCGETSVTAWITSIEIEHLRGDDWLVEIHDGFRWADSFNFAPTVERLEQLRRTDKDGPSGPLGTMVKAVGNHAYGKTLETPNGLELLIAPEAPEGYDVYDPFDETAREYLFCKMGLALRRPHHLPQIGVFVTAHVRCVVRQAALLSPTAFLYADTDCVVFSQPVTLDIDPVRYGAWKQEAAGEVYLIVGKKVYYGDGKATAKGLRTRELGESDYHAWLAGTAPRQEQLQRNNVLKFISGDDMFRSLEREGTDVTASKVYERDSQGRFKPRVVQSCRAGVL